MKHALFLLSLALLGSAAHAAAPSFATPPKVARAGDKVSITFAVAAPTDVEVAVLDAQGKVVRHLAAGVLGGVNPPPPPLAPGLAQTLTWDGRDDASNQCAVSSEQSATPTPDTRHLPPFSIRVRAGTQLSVGAIVASDPFYVCDPLSLATDDSGNLYLLSSSAAGALDFASLRVFNRKGEYLRTVLPMPGTLPREKVAAFDVLPTGEKSWSPRNRCATWPDFYRQSDLANGCTWTMANRVPRDGILNLCNNGSLLRLQPDGSAAGTGPQPAPFFPGKKLGPYAPISPYFHIAASLDGARLYVCGLNGGAWKQQKKSDPDFAAGRILAVSGKEVRTFAEVALGDKGVGPQPRINACDLEGIACDGKGNVLVCDPTAAKVRIFDPEGKPAGEVAVENPMFVACHRKTGEIYVLCVATGYAQSKKMLRKFAPLKDGAKELASIPLPDSGESACMTLDDSADPAVVWVGTMSGHVQYTFQAPGRILRLEDGGAKFTETPHPITFELDGIKEHLAVHPETETVLFRGQYTEAGAVNGLTGEKVALPFKKCIDMAPGQDGNWYVNVTAGWQGFICKYDKSFKPLPTSPKIPDNSPGGKPPENAVGYAFGKYGWGISTAGLAVDRAGMVYSHQLSNEHVNAGYYVIVYTPDGKALDEPWAKGDPTFDDQVLDHRTKAPRPGQERFYSSARVALQTGKDWHYGNQGGGLQIDLQGNIYVGTMLQPLDYKRPAGHEKDAAFDSAVGAIFKFPHEGGQFVNLEGAAPAGKPGITVQRNFWPKQKVLAENAATIYGGLASFAGGYGTGCSCRKPTFAVDGFGRLAIPNAIAFQIRLVDNAGNEILTCGKYGNLDAFVAPLQAAQAALAADDPLKKLAVTPAKPANLNALLKAKPLPATDAAFGWPQGVAATDRALYVADIYNHQIVRLDKSAALEATCAVK
jgi:hypothetical protein